MISWLLFGWPGQVALCIFAVWFAWGILKAIKNPRVLYVSHTKLRNGKRLATVRRQQLLPPWLVREETWLLEAGDRWMSATREGDGKELGWRSNYDFPRYLIHALHGVCAVAEARQEETEEMVGDEKRSN